MLPVEAYPPPPEWASALATAGVTGTNGKTTTASWIGHVLDQLALGAESAENELPGGAVTQTTVAVTIRGEPQPHTDDFAGFMGTLERGRQAGCRFAVLELSSLALGTGFLRCWPCRVGVVTNVTRDHLDVHRSPEHYLASKAQLLLHLPSDGLAVVNGSDPLSELLEEVVPPGVPCRRFTRGPRERPGDLGIRDLRVARSGTSFTIDDGAKLRVRVAAPGAVFAENAAAAVLALGGLGVAPARAVEALEGVAAPRGRFQQVASTPDVIVDYAHTPDALTRTLAAARALCRGSLWVVLGAGGERDQAKRPLMGAAAGAADRVLLTSDNPRQEDPARIASDLRAGIPRGCAVLVELDRCRAIAEAIAGAAREDVIVVAGRGHETHQQVGTEKVAFDDAAVARNLHRELRGA